ncbi:12-oxophytodienoate reductase [Actinoplanes sp. NBRC 101535]|uniref:oxidoreductase n=1 Tax=Actinoplanes sp. NBRC 101535 TaxID=3032196 RepID=UPI0024A01DC1|nr:12-oxophytodienoate reductase [Actinoplanes sp. NBRC 101535]GLX99755.1 oxidoreductase [Actinoplanes sp. NBRC 101535]
MTTTTSLLGPLATPTALAGLTLPNRLVMAPMTRFRSPGGVPTAEVADYYRRRASGLGLIITEGTVIGHPSATHETTVPTMTAGAAEEGWRRVTAEVHAAGGRIATQLWHLGSERSGAAWTPSSMTLSDISEIVAEFAASARVAVRAGFDAVELHAAHGYLLDEFLWPATNRRTDAFGGSPAARALFPAEVIRAVRAEIPASMPLIVRFSQFKERDHDATIAADPTELATILQTLADAGADAFHASQRRFWEPAFPGSPRNLAAWAKHLTGLPAITVGSVALTDQISHQAELHTALTAGDYDLVALGRILLANPTWPALTASGCSSKIQKYRKEHENTYF